MAMALESNDKGRVLQSINRVRMALSVVWMSDISSADAGRHVDRRFFNKMPLLYQEITIHGLLNIILLQGIGRHGNIGPGIFVAILNGYFLLLWGDGPADKKIGYIIGTAILRQLWKSYIYAGTRDKVGQDILSNQGGDGGKTTPVVSCQVLKIQRTIGTS